MAVTTDLDSIKPPHAQETTHDGPDFPVVLIGAGSAMFGDPEGPWGLALRLEKKLGPRLKVQAIVDVNPTLGSKILADRRKEGGQYKTAYEKTEQLKDVAELAEAVKAGRLNEPRAFLIATPPIFRGSTKPNRDVELQINKYFPNAGIMLEKPVATGAPYEESVGDVKQVGERLREQHNGPISAAYMLRYLKGTQTLKNLIQEKGLTVMSVSARLVTAYELAVKVPWWNVNVSQGPTIEQGTHICDLARYFGGEVDIESISAHALEAYEKPGKLSLLAFDQDKEIPNVEERIPRGIAAAWKFESGAIGTFSHLTALHDTKYFSEIEVIADGYQLTLRDPWADPSIHVRRPGSNDTESIMMTDDDPYYTEVSNFIDAVEKGPHPDILSTYEDAAKTYELTWAVRRAAEASSKARRERLAARQA